MTPKIDSFFKITHYNTRTGFFLGIIRFCQYCLLCPHPDGRYPLYFKEIVAVNSAEGDLLWGASFSISMLIVALLSPVLGAVADYGTGKKRFLGVFTGLCVIATASLIFCRNRYDNSRNGASYCRKYRIRSRTCVLRFVPARDHDETKLRARVGVRVCARIYRIFGDTCSRFTPLYERFCRWQSAEYTLSFLIAALFFLCFSLPLFLFLPDKQRTASLKFNFIKIGFSRLRTTFSQFSRYKNIARFLLAYFLFIDGINTIIIFSSILPATHSI